MTTEKVLELALIKLICEIENMATVVADTSNSVPMSIDTPTRQDILFLLSEVSDKLTQCQDYLGE